MTPAVTVDDVSKRFRLYGEKAQSLKERVIRLGRMPHHDFWALRDVGFEVAEGETVGLLGHNGSGKSTLLKCVAGILRPTSGSIRTRGRTAALLELGAGFHPDLTGRENIYLNGSILGLSKAEIDRRFDDIVAFAELEQFVDNQVKHFSSGMYARLGFAVAVNVDPDVLLVDEVLAVGDEAFQRKCLHRIREFQNEGRTILFVTHDADIVRQICDRAVVLDHGEAIAVAEPGSAVRTFRDSLLHREEVNEEPAAEGPRQGPASEPLLNVRIADVDIVYPEAGRDHLVPGEPLEIRVAYEVAERVADVVFGIAIYDTEGREMFGTNTEVLGMPIHAQPGSGEAIFRFPSVRLLDGTFFVTIGVHHPGGIPVYDWSEQGHSFQVVNPGRSSGAIDLQASVEVLGAAAGRSATA